MKERFIDRRDPKDHLKTTSRTLKHSLDTCLNKDRWLNDHSPFGARSRVEDERVERVQLRRDIQASNTTLKELHMDAGKDMRHGESLHYSNQNTCPGVSRPDSPVEFARFGPCTARTLLH